MNKHAIAVLSLIFLLTLAACQQEKEVSPAAASIPRIDNLQKWAEDACQKQRVLTVLVSRADCPWCKKLMQQVLIPDVKSGQFNQQWLLGELRIDAGETVQDFSGKKVATATLAKSWRAELTPTVLFLNRRGEEIAPRITGLKLVDFYDDYLAKSLRQGLENPARCS